MNNENIEPIISKVSLDGLDETSKNHFTQSCQNAIVIQKKKPRNTAVVLLKIVLIIGTLVNAASVIRLPAAFILLPTEPLVAVPFMLRASLAIVCLITVIFVFQKKKCAIYTLYVVLGIFLTLGIINWITAIQQKFFSGADTSIYVVTMLIYFGVYLLTALVIFLLTKRSKDTLIK